MDILNSPSKCFSFCLSASPLHPVKQKVELLENNESHSLQMCLGKHSYSVKNLSQTCPIFYPFLDFFLKFLNNHAKSDKLIS